MVEEFGLSKELLKQFISKIERLEAEKADIANVLRETYAEAKGKGLDPKILRLVLKHMKMDPKELDSEEELLFTYKRALGLIE